MSSENPAARATDDPKPPRKVIDWEAVELQYRAGIRSLKDIGAEFKVSDAGILKRAKRDGWVRDLRAKIQAKADAKVSASLVSGEVSARTRVAEAEVIEAESNAVAGVRLRQRKDIFRGSKLVMALLAELESVTTEPLLLEKIDEILGKLSDGDDPKIIAKARDALYKATSLPVRAGTMKALADSLKTLVCLERQAWGLGEDSGAVAEGSPGKNVDELSDVELEALIRRARPAPPEPEKGQI